LGNSLVLFWLLFCRTIKESNSGSHRGQGHAVVNVERKRKIIEYNRRFREVRILCMKRVDTWSTVQFSPNSPKKSFNIQKINKCAKLSEGYFRRFVQNIGFVVEVDSNDVLC
jgi:hypothetical protein